MPSFSRRKAKQQLDREAGKIRSEDVGDLLSRQQAIEDKVQNSGKLQRFSSDIKLMFSMLRDYWQGNYREVPWKSVAAIAGALVYVMNPMDVIPDLIMGFGFIDDAGVVALCLKMVESDLLRYAAWKQNKEEPWTSQPS
ncbi:YkvA family protein [Marinobacter sp.]|uniref:YkvA family protein n=1 Tax=Marinobacter sp. TaxID=50741 RepID=UPI002B474615|nr:YkvA family protein [Marinobacter sp.]HKK55964.1 YkvA family protein [Marinobacter sp.]